LLTLENDAATIFPSVGDFPLAGTSPPAYVFHHGNNNNNNNSSGGNSGTMFASQQRLDYLTGLLGSETPFSARSSTAATSASALVGPSFFAGRGGGLPSSTSVPISSSPTALPQGVVGSVLPPLSAPGEKEKVELPQRRSVGEGEGEGEGEIRNSSLNVSLVTTESVRGNEREGMNSFISEGEGGGYTSVSHELSSSSLSEFEQFSAGAGNWVPRTSAGFACTSSEDDDDVLGSGRAIIGGGASGDTEKSQELGAIRGERGEVLLSSSRRKSLSKMGIKESTEETLARLWRNSKLFSVEAGEGEGGGGSTQQLRPTPRVFVETARERKSRLELLAARPDGSDSQALLLSAAIPSSARLLGVVSPFDVLSEHTIPSTGLTREQDRALQATKKNAKSSLKSWDAKARALINGFWERDGESRPKLLPRPPPRTGSSLALSYALRAAEVEDGGRSQVSGSFRLAFNPTGLPPERSVQDIHEILAHANIPCVTEPPPHLTKQVGCSTHFSTGVADPTPI